jgi:hypothetical protein
MVPDKWIYIYSNYNLNGDGDPRLVFIPTENRRGEEMCFASIHEDAYMEIFSSRERL